MAHTNPFSEDNYREHLAKYSSDQAPRNPGAIEEVEDVGLTKFRSSSGPDLGLKAVNDEDVNKQHRQAASYRAALQHYPIKSSRGTGVQVKSSLPVYNPGPLKDVGVAHPSTSRASPTYERIVNARAAQLGVNQQSTSDEEKHLKDLHDAKRDDTSPHVSDDISAFEDQSNGKFQLCFVAPKSITDCIAFVKYEVYHLDFINIAE